MKNISIAQKHGCHMDLARRSSMVYLICS